VRNGFRRIAAMTTALFVSATAFACADPLDVTFALTVNPLTGQHEVNGNHTDKLSFAPLPLGELIVRHGPDAVRVEGLPPVTFGYNTSGDGAQSTQLSIVNATYRRTFGNGWFAGVGQTIYNQFTTYVPVNGTFNYIRGKSQIIPIFGSEAQYSRVTGLRWELGRTIERGRDRAEFWAAVNPKMRGIQYTQIPTHDLCFVQVQRGVVQGTTCSKIVNTFADPENASQVDLTARVAHRIAKRAELLYGVRYLNYTAHYDDFPGQIADRNVGFAPLLGLRVKL
jgi:hypothetical protein